MAIATFKQLCIDAVDADWLADFWAAVLRLEVGDRHESWVELVGATPAHAVAINRVPEPVTAKQRLHLDVRADDPDAITALGATVDRDAGRWVVMRDPEGGELCVFGTAPGKPAGLMELVLDCADPAATAQWWGGVLGVPAGEELEHDFWYVENIPGTPFEDWVFVPVPEPKTVKNRIHIDVVVDTVADLVAAGATVLRPPSDDRAWTVLADPEGNEFCAFLRAGG